MVGRALAVAGLNPWVGWYERLPRLGDLLVTSAQNNIFLLWLIIAAAHAVHYARNARLREAQLADARLQALKGQLQPHFLFNALNTVATLVHENPRAADRVLVRLAELLRVSLRSADSHEVPLRTELEVVAAYLEIEQARFEGQLLVKWAVNDQVLDAAVPHLLLQPLVENAIRHGLVPSRGAGAIAITASREGKLLHLAVRNSGVGWQPEPVSGEGVGLANVRARLAQLYPGRHSLRIAAAAPGGTEIAITLPYRRLAVPGATTRAGAA